MISILGSNWQKFSKVQTYRVGQPAFSPTFASLFPGSLDAYMTASKLIREFHGKDTPMEMLNNIGSLHYRLNNYEESRKCFERGITYAEQAREVEPAYANSILVTMRYNLARVYEASFEFDKAETLYKEILREHPKYVDCVLRLGCMARDRGQIYSASDWFKDALEINPNSPDAWTMIGNLHAAKQEWRPGQKKFERILHNPQTANDSYALISLGNIWLQTLYMPTRDKERVRGVHRSETTTLLSLSSSSSSRKSVIKVVHFKSTKWSWRTTIETSGLPTVSVVFSLTRVIWTKLVISSLKFAKPPRTCPMSGWTSRISTSNRSNTFLPCKCTRIAWRSSTSTTTSKYWPIWREPWWRAIGCARRTMLCWMLDVSLLMIWPWCSTSLSFNRN